jgi:hypothetical protein
MRSRRKSGPYCPFLTRTAKLLKQVRYTGAGLALLQQRNGMQAKLGQRKGICKLIFK